MKSCHPTDQGLQRGVGGHPLHRQLHLLHHPRSAALQLADEEARRKKADMVRPAFSRK